MANFRATSYTDKFDWQTGMVFDRTAQDVSGKTSKGFWNISDVNRIEDAVSEMSIYLSLSLSTKTWAVGEIITKTDYNVIYNNIEAIRAVWHVSSSCPSTPSSNAFGYQSANDLEKILSDFLDYKISAETDKIYSGQITAGGEWNA